MNALTVRVIGVGSPSGDDWLGWELAERLRASEVLEQWADQVTVTLYDRPGAALLQAWSGSDLVVLLDAVRSGAVPGTVHRFDTAQLTGSPRALSSHGFGVVDAVLLAAALDSLPTTLLFYGIEADVANGDMGLSDAVHAVLPALVAEIEAMLAARLRAA